MDPFDSFLNPSGDQDADFDSLGLSLLSDAGIHPVANALEGVGVDCELKRFDTIINTKGEQVVLEVGSKRNITVDKGRAPSSALVLNKHWTKNRTIAKKELMIQSLHMKTALKTVVPAYKDFPVHLNHIIIRDEPQCLFHYRDELQAYGASLQDPIAARHVLFLIKHMSWELSTQISTFFYNMDINKGAECLDYHCLWMAFRPGDLVYEPGQGHRDEQIYQLVGMQRKDVSFHSDESSWEVRLHYIVSDGTKLGECQTTIRINQFDGVRALLALPVIPLKYHHNAADIRARLLGRGKKFCSLYGSHHREYRGVANLLSDDRHITALGEVDSFPARFTMISSRIMVDAKAFHEARPAEGVYISPYKKRFMPDKNGRFLLSDDEYLMCDNEIVGYSLQDKKWGFFRVSLIEEVKFNETAFDSLILDDHLKQLILSLVQGHSLNDGKFDDIIRGKGKGMIFLLHGEPGVGKTLTAESVADNTRRPLLRLDATSLGTTAASVEKGLTTALQFSERWKAVLLLDEADVFLNQRDVTHLEHNGLVSVFLRVLEYYEGILFLTTNTVSVFDQALKSRIHLPIPYPKLSRASRQRLWHLFLSRCSAESAKSLEADGTLDRIADEELNGRQVKNVVRLAHSLALREKSLIKARHISIALEPLKNFEHDFQAAEKRAVIDQGEKEKQAKRRRVDA